MPFILIVLGNDETSVPSAGAEGGGTVQVVDDTAQVPGPVSQSTDSQSTVDILKVFRFIGKITMLTFSAAFLAWLSTGMLDLRLLFK